MTAAPPGEQVVVHLEGGSPFGLRLDGGGNDQPIYVSKLHKRSKASAYGVGVGDVLIAINDCNCRGMRLQTAVSLVESIDANSILKLHLLRDATDLREMQAAYNSFSPSSSSSLGRSSSTLLHVALDVSPAFGLRRTEIAGPHPAADHHHQSSLSTTATTQCVSRVDDTFEYGQRSSRNYSVDANRNVPAVAETKQQTNAVVMTSSSPNNAIREERVTFGGNTGGVGYNNMRVNDGSRDWGGEIMANGGTTTGPGYEFEEEIYNRAARDGIRQTVAPAAVAVHVSTPGSWETDEESDLSGSYRTEQHMPIRAAPLVSRVLPEDDMQSLGRSKSYNDAILRPCSVPPTRSETRIPDQQHPFSSVLSSSTKHTSTTRLEITSSTSGETNKTTPTIGPSAIHYSSLPRNPVPWLPSVVSGTAGSQRGTFTAPPTINVVEVTDSNEVYNDVHNDVTQHQSSGEYSTSTTATRLPRQVWAPPSQQGSYNTTDTNSAIASATFVSNNNDLITQPSRWLPPRISSTLTLPGQMESSSTNIQTTGTTSELPFDDVHEVVIWSSKPIADNAEPGGPIVSSLEMNRSGTSGLQGPPAELNELFQMNKDLWKPKELQRHVWTPSSLPSETKPLDYINMEYENDFLAESNRPMADFSTRLSKKSEIEKEISDSVGTSYNAELSETLFSGQTKLAGCVRPSSAAPFLTRPITTDVDQDLKCLNMERIEHKVATRDTMFLQRIVTVGPGNDEDIGPDATASFYVTKKKHFGDSSFYEDPEHKYPTIEEQIKMARKVAQLLTTPSSESARGHQMFIKRKEQSEKWTLDEMNLELKRAAHSAMTRQIYADQPVRATSCLPTSGGHQSILTTEELERVRLRGERSRHDVVPFSVCSQLAGELKTMQGKAGRLFAKHHNKVEELGSSSYVPPASTLPRTTRSRSQDQLKMDLPSRPAVSVAPPPTQIQQVDNSDSGTGGAPVNRLKGMIDLPKAKMTPWDSMVRYGHVEKAFEHLQGYLPYDEVGGGGGGNRIDDVTQQPTFAPAPDIHRPGRDASNREMKSFTNSGGRHSEDLGPSWAREPNAPRANYSAPGYRLSGSEASRPDYSRTLPILPSQRNDANQQQLFSSDTKSEFNNQYNPGGVHGVEVESSRKGLFSERSVLPHRAVSPHQQPRTFGQGNQQVSGGYSHDQQERMLPKQWMQSQQNFNHQPIINSTNPASAGMTGGPGIVAERTYDDDRPSGEGLGDRSSNLWTPSCSQSVLPTRPASAAMFSGPPIHAEQTFFDDRKISGEEHGGQRSNVWNPSRNQNALPMRPASAMMFSGPPIHAERTIVDHRTGGEEHGGHSSNVWNPSLSRNQSALPTRPASAMMFSRPPIHAERTFDVDRANGKEQRVENSNTWNQASNQPIFPTRPASAMMFSGPPVHSAHAFVDDRTNGEECGNQTSNAWNPSTNQRTLPTRPASAIMFNGPPSATQYGYAIPGFNTAGSSNFNQGRVSAPRDWQPAPTNRAQNTSFNTSQFSGPNIARTGGPDLYSPHRGGGVQSHTPMSGPFRNYNY